MDHQSDKQELPLMDDLRTRMLKSVGKATTTQWTTSHQEKQMMPRLTRPALTRLSAKEVERLYKSDAGIFLPRRPQSVEVHGAENPSPKSSFGFTGSFAKVVATSQSVDGFLVLKIERKKLGHLNSDSLRIFRWDEQLRRFELIPHSIVDSQREYVAARIALPGVYTVIGLHRHPAVLETIQIACELKGVYPRLPAKSRDALKKRVCGLILCARDTGELLNGLGDDICDDCLEIPTDVFFDLPECQIIEETPSPCTDSSWECMGPFEIIGNENTPFNRGIGCGKHLMVDPSDHRRVYAAGEHGGLWILNRADRWPQSTWRPLTDQLEGLQIRAIAVAPSDPRNLYVGNSLGFVYRSRNRGVSWSRTSDTNFGFIRRIIVHASTPETLFVASNSGFYLSSNGGASWSQLLLDPAIFTFRTSNTPTPDALDAIMDPNDSSILYIGVRGDGVFKTFDSGQNWRIVLPFSTAFESNRQMIRLALGNRNSDGSLQTDADRTLAVKFGGEVFTSPDGGRTQPQSRVLQGGSGLGPARTDRGLFAGEWCNVLAIDPNNPRIILAGQQDLFKTTDGGASWQNIGGQGDGRLIHEDFQDVRFDPEVPGLAYITCDGGVYVYKDGRVDDPVGGDVNIESFEERNLNFCTSEFYRVGVQGNRAVGNIDHNGLKGTTDIASGVWQRANPADTGNNALEFAYIYADPKRIGRFYVLHDQVFKRLRFPSSVRADLIQYAPFAPLSPGLLAGSPRVGQVAVDMREGSETVLVCANKLAASPGVPALGFRLMLTKEANVEPTLNADNTVAGLPTWETAIDNGAVDPLVSVTFAPRSPGTAFVISANGVVIAKADVNAGAVDANWEVRGQWAQTDVRQIVVHSGLEERLYTVSGRSFGRSPDGGRTWPSDGVTSPPGTDLNSIVAHPYDPFTLFIGADSGVFVSYDDGQNWSPFDDGLPNAEITQVLIERGYLYAVTFGRGLWRRKIC